MKVAVFLGNSLDAVRAFPAGARREIGFQIERLQRGLDPDDWKPMKAIGPSVREIRVRNVGGTFRVIYVAAFADAVFILHAFQKKTAATSRRDLSVATARFKEMKRSIQG